MKPLKCNKFKFELVNSVKGKFVDVDSISASLEDNDLYENMNEVSKELILRISVYISAKAPSLILLSLLSN